MILRKKHVILFCLNFSGIIFSSCTNPFGGFSNISVFNTKISGLAKMHISSASNSVVAQCATPLAELYEIDVQGQISETALASVAIGTDGFYEFDRVDRYGVTLDNITNYIVKTTGCSESYSRPVTDFEFQDIEIATTLFEKIPISGSSQKLNQIPVAKMVEALKLVSQVSGGNLKLIYNSIKSDPVKKSKLESLIGVHLADLEFSRPQIKVLSSPIVGNEITSNIFSVQASHWYDAAALSYFWEINGQQVGSNSDSFDFIPTKNSQGLKTIKLTVGHDSGGGTPNIFKPLIEKEFQILITNSQLPQVPFVSLLTPGLTNNSTLQYQVATGPALSECESFSKLAITESSLLQPVPSDFNLVCVTSPTQNLTYTVGPGDGLKQLRLWAIDEAGVISLTPQVFSLTLDQTSPLLSLDPLPSNLKGGDSVDISFTANDLTAGLNKVDFYYAADGTNFNLIQSGVTSPYSWLVPTVNLSSAKIKLIALDMAGNSTTVTSSAFTIDSTAPTSLTIVRTSNALSNNQDVVMNVGGCSGDAIKMLFQEASAPPLAGDMGWEDCAATKTYHVSSADGAKSIYAFAKDTVGNISAVSNQITMTLDQTAPAISLTSLNSGSFRGGSIQNITYVASDAHFTVTPITLEYSTDSGVTYIPIASNQTNSGSYAWTLPMLDNNQVKIRVTAIDQLGQSASVVSTNNISIDSTAPIVSTTVINDGDTYAGTSIVGVKSTITDNFSTASQIKARVGLANSGTNDCQSEYADDNWQTYTNATTNLTFTLPASDGVKKLCVWAKDDVGNVSVMSPTAGTQGVDIDTITVESGNIPVVASFSVVRTSDSAEDSITAGQPLTITWQATDVEGLHRNTINLSYSTDNSTWKDIITNQNISTLSNMTWISSLGGELTDSGLMTYTLFNAPTSSKFRMRIQAQDKSGNRSLAVMSNILNATPWKVYAGSRDRGIGSTGRSAVMTSGYNHRSYFAINPKNGDIYAADNDVGIIKLDAKTGIVSRFLRSNGTNNLPNSGALPADPTLYNAGQTEPFFDSQGRFYIFQRYSGSSVAVKLYQIDLETNSVRLYAGGGLGNDGGAGVLSTDLNIASSFAFDEDNSLYLWTYCTPNPVSDASETASATRLIKILQNPDGSPGSVSRIIGDCTNNNPTSGSLAINAPAGNIGLKRLVGFAVWDHGQKIMIIRYDGMKYKILNGTVYNSNISMTAGYSLNYNSQDQKLYKTNSTFGLEQISVNASGDNGEVTTTLFNANSVVAGCANDDSLSTQFCGRVSSRPQFLDGKVYFADGAETNSSSTYQVRYFDANQKLKTVLGSPPFSGDGLHRLLAKGKFSGIYYKKASEPNQVAFPEGLYFQEPYGVVTGYIHPTSGIVTNIFGNQSRQGSLTPGVTATKDLSMGVAYNGGNAMPLTFDNQGLPWFRANNKMYSLDQDKKIVARAATSNLIQAAPNNADPNNYGLTVYGGWHNFTLKNNMIFIQENYYYPPTYDPKVTIRLMNYTTNQMPILIGGNYLASQNQPASADILTPGAVSAAAFAGFCRGNSSCRMVYNSTDDRLYFSEGTAVRYITTPDVPATSILVTLFSKASTIANLAINPSGTQLWYLMSSGLYCKDLTSGKSWCDNTTNYYSIGTAFAPLVYGANQITFKDDSIMYFSTYNGEILEFRLPTGP